MAEERVERRLAAILAADVAGYSRLMGNDEEGTRARLLSGAVTNVVLDRQIEIGLSSRDALLLALTLFLSVLTFASIFLPVLFICSYSPRL